MNIVLRERVWVPKQWVDRDRLKKAYTTHMFEEKGCVKCEHKDDRPNEVCDTCPAYKGLFTLYRRKQVKGVWYYGLPPGDRQKIAHVVPKFRQRPMKDLRSTAKAQTSFEFCGTLRPDQVPAVNALEKKKRGILKAPPRTGKTVMAADLTARLGFKTLILVHQHDLALQFLETFHDPEFTDIQAVEKFEGRPLVGLCKTFEDFKRHDVCITTYQGFLRHPKRLKAIRDMFGLVIIDEVHRGNAWDQSARRDSTVRS